MPRRRDYYDRALALDPDNVGHPDNALVAQVALGDVDGGAAAGRPAGGGRPGQPGRRRWCGSATRWRRATSTEAQAVLDEGGADTVNPLLGGLLAGWIDVGREDFAAAQAPLRRA